MAARYFAAAATDLNTTASWSTAFRGATGAAVPVANDEVYFIEGSQIISTNPTALNVDLDLVYFGPNFVGDFGTSGTSITVGCSGSPATFKIDSRGARFFLVAGSAGIDNLYINAPSVVRLTGGTFTNVYAYSGEVYVDASATVTNLFASGATIEAADGTAFTTLTQSGGRVLDYRGVTGTSFIAGSKAAFVSAVGDAAYGTVEVVGGRFNHRSAGVITTLNVRAGRFDVDGAVLTPGTTSITTANVYGTADTTLYASQVGLVDATVGTLNDFSLGAKQTIQGSGTGR
jgi:hypothetical protein